MGYLYVCNAAGLFVPVSASLLIYIWSSEDTAASEAACGLLVTVRFYLVYWWFNASYINVCFRWIGRKMLLLKANDELKCCC